MRIPADLARESRSTDQTTTRSVVAMLRKDAPHHAVLADHHCNDRFAVQYPDERRIICRASQDLSPHRSRASRQELRRLSAPDITCITRRRTSRLVLHSWLPILRVPLRQLSNTRRLTRMPGRSGGAPCAQPTGHRIVLLQHALSPAILRRHELNRSHDCWRTSVGDRPYEHNLRRRTFIICRHDSTRPADGRAFAPRFKDFSQR